MYKNSNVRVRINASLSRYLMDLQPTYLFRLKRNHALRLDKLDKLSSLKIKLLLEPCVPTMTVLILGLLDPTTT